jgi:PAS domain-containing protein
MIFAGVRLPEEIRIAQENERLVIFAGAGVSVGPPSKLPNFNRLASLVAGGRPVNYGHEDKFLGKLKHEGTDVHAATARLLLDPKSSPTKLHEQILALFGRASAVRVVTTNFDNHFSTIAQRSFKNETLREFHAPALPLGDDFSGLVYLHGSARIDAQSLVLTDKDFGTAYLTRGWARDFLVPLFTKYTVLFVGYSHSDVIVSYLARGLNISPLRRWALVDSSIRADQRENWDHLQVSITEYPIDPDNTEDPHHFLTDFFVDWARHTSESLTARAKRLRAIARALPPENLTVSEYLEYCLRVPRLAEDFCASIRHPAWVGWMHDHGYFKPLFSDVAISPRTETVDVTVLSRWLSSYVRRKYPEILLGLIETHHQKLTREFSLILAHTLWVDQTKKPDPRFGIWVLVLLSQGKAAVPENIWAYLLKECRIPEHCGVALRLFELLTNPDIELEKSIDVAAQGAASDNAANYFRTKKVDYSISWPTESKHWLRDAWEHVFAKNLSIVADSLVLIVTKQLILAHQFSRITGKANDRYDALSWHRSSIAPHEQDADPLEECLSILVESARKILLHWVKTDPMRARAQADAWWTAKPILLRRLAVYAKSIDPQYGADERIIWLIENDLLFRSGMKKEVFDVLASAYSTASLHVRRRLLDRIDRGYTGPGARKLDLQTLAYEKFNILIWLRRIDGKCSQVESAIAKIIGAHSSFSERDHPDFDHWTSDVCALDPKEGFDFDKILLDLPIRYYEALRKGGDHGVHCERWNYIANLSTLFTRSKDWGRSFVEMLTQETNVDDEIWEGVFIAWREVIKTSDDWEWMLTFIEKLPHKNTIYEGVANLVSHGIWNKEAKLADPIIDRAATLIDRAWTLCSVGGGPPDESYRNWLNSAINHVGGWIGEFWVHYCNHLYQRHGSTREGIPSAIRARMEDALAGTNRTKIYARIALTAWIGHIFTWDREFAITHFLPLLDWRKNPIIAQQTWSVILNYRRGTSLDLETELIPFYRQFVERITSLLKRTSERSDQFDEHALENFGQYLAGLAMRVIPNPVDSGFFRDFLPLLPDNVRAALAHGMERHLEQMSSEEQGKLWTTWLRDYLDLRLMGVPVALSVGETKHILEWCLHLRTVFPEAVDRVVQMPFKAVFAYSVIKDLLGNSVLAEFPLHACRFANVTLKAEDFPHLHDDLVSLHAKLKAKISNTEEIKELEELLYLRGWKK